MRIQIKQIVARLGAVTDLVHDGKVMDVEELCGHVDTFFELPMGQTYQGFLTKWDLEDQEAPTTIDELGRFVAREMGEVY
jgi:hypothetical protein